MTRTDKQQFRAEYKVYREMLARCSNASRKSFKYYGGRGIKVCDRWKAGFSNFMKDMGPRPTDKHSVDRYPNNDGDYEPSNCRWATQKEQMANTRRSAGGRPGPLNGEAYARLLQHFSKDGKLRGAKTRMAIALGCSSRQVVDRWERYGIPMKYAERIKELTGMKPDQIWPENFK